eukprot:5408925-Pleurochrysis_carterae.AAC.1
MVKPPLSSAPQKRGSTTMDVQATRVRRISTSINIVSSTANGVTGPGFVIRTIKAKFRQSTHSRPSGTHKCTFNSAPDFAKAAVPR